MMSHPCPYSMTTSNLSFTMSSAKRPDVTGDPKQAFAYGETVASYMMGAIAAKTLAAFGFVNQSKMVQYIYAPQVHSDLSGKPLSIVGNASNKAGECCLIALDITSIGMFHSILKKGADLDIINSFSLPPELLVGTMYEKGSTQFVFATVPNVHFLYYGQEPPKGLITSEDTKHAFSLLGKGYDVWAHLADISITKDAIIDTILTTANKTPGSDKAYEAYNTGKLRQYGVTTVGDSALTIATFVDSGDYPAITAGIKAIFTPTPPAAHGTSALTTVTVTSPSDIGKDEEAAKGVSKFLLFFLCGDVDFGKTTITNVALAKPSTSMSVVMAANRTARPQALADLLRSFYETARKTNNNDIRSKEISMINVTKALSTHLMAGNFATERVTSMFNEAHAVDMLAFAPQRNTAAINNERVQENDSSMEATMDIPEAHRKKTSTTMSRSGSIASIRDVRSLCINILTLILAVTDGSSPTSILYQLLTKIVDLTNNHEFNEWMEYCGPSMKHLHFLILKVVDTIWVNAGKSSVSFLNVNIMSNNLPVATLDMSYFNRALIALNALIRQFENAQASMIPITILPESIVAFVPATPPNTGGRNRAATTGTATPGATNPGAATTTPKGSATKRNEGTPEGGVSRDADHPSKKKRFNASEKKEVVMKEMGMFYLTAAAMKKSNVFPSAITICPDFACKGRECTAENCVLDHPRKPTDIKVKDLKDIAKCFHRSGDGWLSAYHFRFLSQLNDDAKAMM